jgi:uncharacterized membrane protein
MSMLAAGCSSSTDTPNSVDCNGTPPSYDDVTAFTKCVACHDSKKTGAARVKAPANINFDTAEAALASADKAVSEVMKGDMPPRDSGVTLTDAERQQLYEWAMCTM